MTPLSDLPPNSYQPPRSTSARAAALVPQHGPGLLLQTIVMVDFLLLNLRAVFVVVQAISISAVQEFATDDDRWMMAYGIAGVAASALMVLAGYPADIAMLMGQRWGRFLAWIKIFATADSIVLACLQLPYMTKQQPMQPLAEETAYVVFAAVILLRGVFLVVYVGAVVRYSKWILEKK